MAMFSFTSQVGSMSRTRCFDAHILMSSISKYFSLPCPPAWADVHCPCSGQPLRPPAGSQGQDLHLRDGRGGDRRLLSFFIPYFQVMGGMLRILLFRTFLRTFSPLFSTPFQVMGGMLGIPNYSKLEAVLLLLGAVGAFLCWSSQVLCLL